MAEHLPAIVVLLPMFAALVTALTGMKDERVGFPIAMASLGGTFVATIALLRQVIADGPVSYFMGGWSAYSGIGIELRVDSLNACVLVVIACVAVLTAIYSCQRVAEDTPGRSTPFYSLYLLLCSALMGMSVTADAFNLFVLIEVSSLASYGLVAMGTSKRGTLAAFNYIIMGTIGASFYLLGAGYLYMSTGTLDMSGIHAAIVTQRISPIQKRFWWHSC